MRIDIGDPAGGRDVPLHEMVEEFAAVPEVIPRARHAVVRSLRSWGLAELISPLELAIGELVTNAVSHGQGPITLALAIFPGRLRAEVHDRGGGTPAMRPVHTSGPRFGGWGLSLVDRLVDVWGSDVRTGHTVVWVELRISTDGADRGHH